MARRMPHETAKWHAHCLLAAQVQSPGYRGRTRSEQRHLLVELELDDSVVLTPKARFDGHAQHHRHLSAQMHARDQGARRVSAADAYDGGSDRRYPRYPSEYTAFPDEDIAFDGSAVARRSARPRSAKTRASYSDSTVSSHNTQKKLLSPYKLKQKVLSSRHQLNPTPDSVEHEGRRAGRNPRTTSESSPLTLIASSLRQNAQLRDQLVAQLQQEVSSSAMNVSHLDRFSPPQLSPRLVKILNKLRSLSLSIVEMQLYFRKEILESGESPAAIAHVERELQAYLLQMIASDVDFLSCFSPLIGIFDTNGVSLVRNPLAEGLSLDSSELLLCSCNHVSSSSYSSSAAATSSPLFQLLVHKLEAFALYMRKLAPTWQVLPPERVAAALLHLVELENCANATRLLPSYLRSPPASSSSVPAWDRNQPVQFSSATSQMHRQSSPWTEFADEEEDIEKDIPIHHRSSFVAWDADAVPPVPSLPRMQSGIVNKQPQERAAVGVVGDPVGGQTTSSKQPLEDSIPLLAETKQQGSATKVSAKKRKGSSSEETAPVISSRERQVEAKSLRLETSNARGSIIDTSDAKSRRADGRQESEAMVSVDENALHKTDIDIERQQETFRIDESANDGIHPDKHDGSIKSITDHSTRQVDSGVGVPPAKAFEIVSTPDSNLEESVSGKVLPRHQNEDESEGLSSCELPPSNNLTSEVVSENRAYSAHSREIEPVACSFQQSPALLVSNSDQTVLDEANSYQDKVSKSFEWGSQHADEVSRDSMFEYSSERTLSMIASALDLLPSFSHLESTISLVPTVVATSSSSQMVPATKNRTRDDEINFENTSTLHPLKVFEKLVDSDFEDIPNDEEERTTDQDCPSKCEPDFTPSEPVFEKIYSLCRDVQVAAFDMSYHFDNLVAKERERESPVQKQSARFVLSSYEPPLYLERELKMLRRYFRPWRDFAFEQTEAKRFVRRRAASRQIFQFVYGAHRARQSARNELEKFQRNSAAGRIQKNWRIHRLRVRIRWQKAAFRSTHMTFKRCLFYVRITKCRRRREVAKETIHRWWRRCRDKWRKQEAERTHQLQIKRRQYQAAKEVQCFFRETILRQRLARVAKENQQILFKSQLHSLKARQESEKRRKSELKVRREQESRMKSALNDLESKWKHTEIERIKLLDHHKRVLGRYQHLEGKRRQQLAQLKITAFLDTCLLHRKIKKVELEREKNQVQWQLLSREKEQLERETEQGRAKDKVQLRVLHRKLAKLENEKTSLAETQQMLLETHKQRLQQLQEHVARTTIKAFIDARLIQVKSRRERLEQLRVQKQIMAEKDEQERMVCEDLAERERVARAEMDALEQLLERAQQDVDSLTIQQERLIAEKELEAATAHQMIEATIAEKNRIIISKWLSQQIRTSREKAELARAVEVEKQRRLEVEREKELLELKREEEKRSRQIKFNLASLQRRKSQMKQHMIADKRQREAATSMICSFVERRIRLRREKQWREEMELQQELRKFLVETIIDTRFVSEKLANTCLTSAATSIYRISVRLHHKHTRLKYLQRGASARKIQRCWQSWRRVAKQRQLENERAIKAQTMRQHACARKIQRRWLRWRAETKKRQAAEHERQERSLAIRSRVCCRKIQRKWHQWRAEVEEERLKRVRDEKLAMIYRGACARKIQHCYRHWQQRLIQRRLQTEEHRRAEQAAVIRRRSCAHRIQKWWKRVIKLKQNQRVMEILAEEHWQAERVRQERLRYIRNRSLARKIQQQWRKWRRRVHERQLATKLLVKQRLEAELSRLAKLDSMRRLACARKIQRKWRQWCRSVQERQQAAAQMVKQCLETELSKRAKADSMLRHAYTRKIEKQWRQWRKAVEESQKAAELLAKKRLEAEEAAARVQAEYLRQHACARKIQRKWRRWRTAMEERRIAAELLATKCHEAELARYRQAESMRRHACVRMVQRTWRQWRIIDEDRRNAAEQLSRERLEAEAARLVKANNMRQHSCAQKIQKKWRLWRVAMEECRKAAQQLAREYLEAEAARRVKLESIRQRTCARKIQRSWRKWRISVKEHRKASEQLTRQCFEAEIARDVWANEMRRHACARTIQRKWRKWRILVAERRSAAKLLARECLEFETAKCAKIESLRRHVCVHERSSDVGESGLKSVAERKRSQRNSTEFAAESAGDEF